LRTICLSLLLAVACGSFPAEPQIAPASETAELPLLDVESYRKLVESHRGKAVLVNFWATWCEPCQTEYPTVVQLARDFAGKDLVVVGVNFDDEADRNVRRRFLERHKPAFANYRVKADIHGPFVRAVHPEWRGSIPATFVYDREGRLAARLFGEQKRPQFERAIQAALASSSQR
jgi:thiol-disulfide isomerase/thioredoxin